MSVIRPIENMNVYEAAERRILMVFSKHHYVDLAFSGGKDSIALLLVTIKTMQKYHIDFKRLSVEFVDEEAIYPDVPDVVEHYRRMVLSLGARFNWLCLPWRHYNCTNTLNDEDSWTCWDVRAKDKWVRTPPPYALRWHPDFKYGMSYQEFFANVARKHKGYVQIVGVRAAESVQRLMAFYSMAYGNGRNDYKKNVIYDWKDTDVWKIIMDNNAVFPKTYMNLWRVGAKLRMSQIFAADTCRSIPKMLVFYPNFYEKLQRRCPNIDIVLLYYDTRLFKSSSQQTKHGVGNDEETLREKIRKGLADAKAQGRTDNGYKNAKRAWRKTQRYRGLNVNKVYKPILEMLYGGDAKSRTYRAFMIGLNASLTDLYATKKDKK